MVDYGGSYESIFLNNKGTGYLKNDFYKNWMNNMSVAKYCPTRPKTMGCVPTYDFTVPSGMSYFSPASIDYYPAVWVLKDGLIIKAYWNGNFDRHFMIDINGFKKPNKMGKDVFMFTFNNKKIIPDNSGYTMQDGGKRTSEMMK